MDMNSSLMLHSFRIRSSNLVRISTNEDMSKDVSDAAVFSDSLRRPEMRRRMRFIFTLHARFIPTARSSGWRLGFVFRFLWLDQGEAGSVSIFGGVVLLSFFWWWRGGIFGVFHCLVASFLRILGSVLVLGSGGGICRS